MLFIITSINHNHPEILISLDTEKSFTGANAIIYSWLCQGLDLAQNSCSLNYFILPGQTNSISSNDFPVNCSSGLPPFSHFIRASYQTTSHLSGIIRGWKEHKVSLYAGDILLYISNPSKLMLVIKSTLEILFCFVLGSL